MRPEQRVMSENPVTLKAAPRPGRQAEEQAATGQAEGKGRSGFFGARGRRPGQDREAEETSGAVRMRWDSAGTVGTGRVSPPPPRRTAEPRQTAPDAEAQIPALDATCPPSPSVRAPRAGSLNERGPCQTRSCSVWRADWAPGGEMERAQASSRGPPQPRVAGLILLRLLSARGAHAASDFR